MSRAINFVEGEVDDINVDVGGYSRAGTVTLRYATIRLKLSENKYIDVRFTGYTGPITIVKGHRIKAFGNWVRENFFKANKIVDLTTGEWWEARNLYPVYIALIGLLVFITLFTIFLMSNLFIELSHVILLFTATLILILIATVIFMIQRIQRSYKIIK